MEAGEQQQETGTPSSESPPKRKSYRGCRRCRRGRRRCTEEKPACAACVKAGVKCEYDIDSLFRVHDFQGRGAGRGRTTGESPTLHPATAPGGPQRKSSSSSSQLPSSATTPGLSPLQPGTAPIQPRVPVEPSGAGSTLGRTSAPQHARRFISLALDEHWSDNEELTLDETSALYFKFFLSELPNSFPYVNLFPWAAATLFAESNHHPALRQCVLSVAAMLEAGSSEQLRTKAFNYLQKALNLLQNSISSLDVDEGVAISSFLLAYLGLILGDLGATILHLRGLLLVFHRLDPDTAHHMVTVPSPEHITPLTTLIWRMAIRVDFIASIATGKAPILPPLSEADEGVHIRWILSYANQNVSAHNAEWAEAWFALDALMHQTCQVATQVAYLRQHTQEDNERKIQELLAPIIEKHRKWDERIVVVKAQEIERAGQLHSPLQAQLARGIAGLPEESQPHQFLDYPVLHITDLFVGNRLNNWRSIQLYLSLIQDPKIGRHRGRVFIEAVDVCRTFASTYSAERNFLGAERATGLYLAGVIFGGRDMYTRESEWVEEQLSNMTSFNPIASTLIQNLHNVWELKDDLDYWEVLANSSLQVEMHSTEMHVEDEVE